MADSSVPDQLGPGSCLAPHAGVTTPLIMTRVLPGSREKQRALQMEDDGGNCVSGQLSLTCPRFFSNPAISGPPGLWTVIRCLHLLGWAPG